MKLKPETPSKSPDLSGFSTAELLSVVEGLQQELAAKKRWNSTA
jgi:transposase